MTMTKQEQLAAARDCWLRHLSVIMRACRSGTMKQGVLVGATPEGKLRFCTVWNQKTWKELAGANELTEQPGYTISLNCYRFRTYQELIDAIELWYRAEEKQLAL